MRKMSLLFLLMSVALLTLNPIVGEAQTTASKQEDFAKVMALAKKAEAATYAEKAARDSRATGPEALEGYKAERSSAYQAAAGELARYISRWIPDHSGVEYLRELYREATFLEYAELKPQAHLLYEQCQSHPQINADGAIFNNQKIANLIEKRLKMTSDEALPQPAPPPDELKTKVATTRDSSPASQSTASGSTLSGSKSADAEAESQNATSPPPSTQKAPTTPDAEEGGGVDKEEGSVHTTVEGCLSGSAGSYTLTDSSGRTWQLRGDDPKLSENVGHEVSIRVTAPSSSAAPGLKVQSIKQLSSTCGPNNQN